MIKSKFVLDILDLLIDEIDESKLIKTQLDYLTDYDYHYTNGGGCFVTFSHNEKISSYKINKDLMLDGVRIESKEPNIVADALLFIKDGIIDYLEIWCWKGDYPKEELKTYTLRQYWEGCPNRVVEK